MQILSWLVIWDAILFVVVLAAGLGLTLLPARRGRKPSALRRRCGKRVAVASLLFVVAAPLDGWKPGAGVLISMAGLMAVLAWCLMSVCQNLDGKE